MNSSEQHPGSGVRTDKREQPDSAGARAASPVEILLANFRPQPAIPAVLVFLVAVLMPARLSGAQPSGPAPIVLWLVPAGILVSCGLAVAAGFCSLFPQLIWLAMAGWALTLVERGMLSPANRYFLYAGMSVAVAAFLLQVWRVRSGQFVPTIHTEDS